MPGLTLQQARQRTNYKVGSAILQTVTVTDYFYRLMPAAMGRVLSTLVDVFRCAFLGYSTWLCALLIQWWSPGGPMPFDWWTIGACVGLALLGEIFEFGASAVDTARPVHVGMPHRGTSRPPRGCAPRRG